MQTFLLNGRDCGQAANIGDGFHGSRLYRPSLCERPFESGAKSVSLEPWERSESGRAPSGRTSAEPELLAERRRETSMRSKRNSHKTTNLIERVRSILASKYLTLHQVSRKSETLYGRSSPYFLPHNLYFDLRAGTFSPSIHQLFALSRISGYRLADWLKVFGFHLEDLSRLQILLPSNRTVLLNSSLDDPNAWVPWLDNRVHTTPAPAVAPLAHLLGFTHCRRLGSLSETAGRGLLYAKIGNNDVFPSQIYFRAASYE